MPTPLELRPFGLLAVCILITSPVGATTFTLTLDDVAESSCGPTWDEGACTLWFEPTVTGDMTPGYCLVNGNVTLGAWEGVYIFPARLVVDLSDLSGLETVELDVYETHFAGSTRAWLYSQGGQVDYTQSTQELTHTITLSSGGSAVDKVVVSGHESAVWEIRLSGAALTPTEPSTFGSVKARYR